jgi:hypothetical protein
MAEAAKRKSKVIAEKSAIKFKGNHTEKDFESVMDKLAEAAYRYDRLMPGTVQLDAFECEKMGPEVFRYIL